MVALKELFTIKYGVNLEFNTMHEVNGGLPFVARGSQNNGVVGYVKRIGGLTPNPSMTISVSASGSVMESFLQEKEYYSGRDLYYLQPKVKLSKNEMLYYCMILKQNKYRYSYGRQANKTIDNLLVPSIKEIPDWVYTAKLPRKPSDKPFFNKQINLTDRDWEYFYLKDLFDITGTRSFTKKQIAEYGTGEFPYVVTSSENNGVQGFYDNFTEKGNCLTIDSATVGSCFYQPLNFSASDHVEKLIPLFEMNSYIGMFIQTIIGYEKFRYGYGRKFSQKRIKTTKIKLPIDCHSNPDWQFMEDYIKSLPYSSHL